MDQKKSMKKFEDKKMKKITDLITLILLIVLMILLIFFIEPNKMNFKGFSNSSYTNILKDYKKLYESDWESIKTSQGKNVMLKKEFYTNNCKNSKTDSKYLQVNYYKINNHLQGSYIIKTNTLKIK